MDTIVGTNSLWHKMQTCVFIFILILQLTCPVYAGTQSESMDSGIEESLSGQDQEQAADSRFHGHLGGEINYAAGIKNNASYRGRLIDLFRVEYDKRVYVSNMGGLEGGVWLWQTPDHTQKLGASVQMHSSITEFDSTLRRQNSTDGVIKAEWKMDNNNLIHLSYHHDIGNASKGDSVTLALSRHVVFRQALFNHDCMLIPGIAIEWESARFVDYYYGVRPEEAAPSRPAYVGRDTLNGGAKLTGFYLINKSWTAFAGIHAAVFGPGITDSPVVTRHVTTRGYIGSAWLF